MKTIELTLNRGVITDEIIHKIFHDNNGNCFPPNSNRIFQFDSFVYDQLKSIEANKLNQYSYINMKYLKATENSYKTNNIVQNLNNYFNNQSVKKVIQKYRIGTSKTWHGATIFWYIDIQGKVCRGEILKFDKLWNDPIGFDGKPFVESMRTVLYKQGLIDDNFNQKDILFGEHLLKDTKKPIAIVESEKTAIMASLRFPEYIWLATGLNSELTYDKVKLLIGRSVTLCPKKGKFNSWHKKAIEYGFKLSLLIKKEYSYLENNGVDLSNFILEEIQVEQHYLENQD